MLVCYRTCPARTSSSCIFYDIFCVDSFLRSNVSINSDRAFSEMNLQTVLMVLAGILLKLLGYALQ